MLMKLAIFALGYVLGSRAGRERYNAIVAGARDIVRGDEVASAIGFVRGAIWILSQRGRSQGRRTSYRTPDD